MSETESRLGRFFGWFDDRFGIVGKWNIRWKIEQWNMRQDDLWRIQKDREYYVELADYKERLKDEAIVHQLLAQGFKTSDASRDDWLYDSGWDQKTETYHPHLITRFDPVKQRYAALEKELPEGFYIAYEQTIVRYGQEYLSFYVFDYPYRDSLGDYASGEWLEIPIGELNNLDAAVLRELRTWVQIHSVNKRYFEKNWEKRLRRFERLGKALGTKVSQTSKTVPVEPPWNWMEQ